MKEDNPTHEKPAPTNFFVYSTKKEKSQQNKLHKKDIFYSKWENKLG